MKNKITFLSYKQFFTKFIKNSETSSSLFIVVLIVVYYFSIFFKFYYSGLFCGIGIGSGIHCSTTISIFNKVLLKYFPSYDVIIFEMTVVLLKVVQFFEDNLQELH